MVENSAQTPQFSDNWGASYRLVEPGAFTMGDVHGGGTPSEGPPHDVMIEEPFFSVNAPSPKHNGWI